MLKLLVGDSALVAGLAFPDDSSLVATAGFDVAVDSIFADVELSSLEPRGGGCFPVEDFVPLLLSLEVAGFVSPECVWIFDGLFVHALVLLHAGYACFCRKFLGRLDEGVFVDYECVIGTHEIIGSLGE